MARVWVPGGKTGVFSVYCPVCKRNFRTKTSEVAYCSPGCMAAAQFPAAGESGHRQHRLSVPKSEYDPDADEKARRARFKALEDYANEPFC